MSDTFKKAAALSIDKYSVAIKNLQIKKTDTEISVRNHGAEPTWE
jgi:hypothetical protein